TDRTAPERHQTLQAVIDWSWQLLDHDARTALMTMSLLPDAFGIDCAEDILGASAMRTIDELVDQSLLTVIEREGRVRSGCSRPSANTATSAEASQVRASASR